MKIKLVLALLVFSGITLGIVLNNQKPEPIAVPTTTHVAPPSTTAPIPKPAPVLADIVMDVNNERLKAGLFSLVDDARLDASAATKCADLVAKDYFTHNTPDGTPWYTFITATGIRYQTAGENLAHGYVDAASNVRGWMNSSEHRANILHSEFTHEGIAICHSDNYLSTGEQYIVVQQYDLPK